MSRHLIIACGGTGGHFYPTISIARAFIDLGGKVTLLVAGKHAAEQLKTAADAGIDAREVGFIRRPENLFGWFTLPFKYLAVKRATSHLISELKPDIALGMGSYASVATCKALPSNVPLVLHEGNAFMGKANRIFARRASAIGLSLPLNDEKQAQGTPTHCVGMPLRETLIQASQRTVPVEGFYEKLGLKPGVFTVLVFGGSQGALRINQLLSQVPPLLKGKGVQFIHLTGTDDNATTIQAYADAGICASVRRADYNIEECYLASNLIICRGGASTLCELALFGKPAVIIPLPSAADDHQTVNARLAEKNKAAIHLAQSSATPEIIANYINDAIENTSKYQQMGNNLKVFSKTDSAKQMAELLMNTK